VASDRPDLLILDTRYYRYNYLAICDALRRQADDLPVLVLLPMRDADLLYHTLDHGADDCLTVPFSHADVVVRVRVLLRRRRQQQTLPISSHLIINKSERQATVNEMPLKLTAIEFDLLAVLADHPRVVMSREQLVALVWGDADAENCRLVDSHICRLRKKMQDSGLTHDGIHSVRSIGYIFRPDA